MKLQKLRLQGLRSFTRETEIDLAHLGEQGLFAIYGPTGAGKSTILDAIFLALFGRCPRGDASECVSMGALDLAVRLELCLGRDAAARSIAVERRFHWSKKRGAPPGAMGADLRGTPKHPPLRIEEKKGDAWAPVDLGGKKPDEFLSEEIVRVSISDFQQAVVLPQGEFDALLRARPADRRTLVASLFRTEHLGKPLIDALKAREDEVRGEIGRLGEAAREIATGAEEAAAAVALAEEALTLAEQTQAALTMAEQVAVERRLARERSVAREAAEAALAAASEAQRALGPDRARAALAQQARGAEAALAEFARGEVAMEASDQRAMSAGQAAHDAEVALRQASRALAEASAARAATLPEVLAQLGRARLALERGQGIARLEDERATAEREQRAESAESAAAREAYDAAAAELVAIEAEEQAATAQLASTLQGLTGQLEELSADLAAARARALAAAESLESAEAAARALARRAREAEELNRALDKRRERAARARAQVIARSEELARKDSARLAADARLGAASVLVAARREEIRGLLAALEPEGQHDLFAAPRAPRTPAQWISALEARCATLTANEEGARAALDEARAAAEQRTLSAREAFARRDEAQDQLARARAAVREATAEAGFESVEALRCARIDPAALAAMVAEIDRIDREHARLSAVFDERARDAAVLVKEEEARAAEHARDEARRAAHEAAERSTRAVTHRDELARRRLRSVQLQAQIALLEPRAKRLGQIQKIVASNQLAELAAERHLEAVTRGAASILRALSGDRYALVRDEDGAFAVADSDHGGLLRPPSTLSGGETFLVSLALALSLSERIQFAGRTQFDFFFLDEGFGSLDAGTLDVALGALERLRGPQRVIGMISHVGVIEERMPRKLRVLPGRSARVAHFPPLPSSPTVSPASPASLKGEEGLASSL